MKKKSYKAIQNKYARMLTRELYAAKANVRSATYERKRAEHERDQAIDESKWYRGRFEKLGSRFEAVTGGPIQVIETEVEPERWGQWMAYTCDEVREDEMELIKSRLVESIASGLMKRNIVQFIVNGRLESGPLSPFSTIGAKLYVIPWDRMPAMNPLKFKQVVNATCDAQYAEAKERKDEK